MKRKDFSTILLSSLIVAIFSYILANAVFRSPTNRQQEVEVVNPISANFPSVDKKYFNQQSINPTQLIQIGGDTNKQPL